MVRTPGVGNFSTAADSLGSSTFDATDTRLLEVRGVVAPGAESRPVLSRLGDAHELDGLASPHRPRGRLNGDGAKPAPLENSAIGFRVPIECGIETREVDVEAVGVLHGELATSQHARLRTGLVAKLGLDLEPDLRELTVAPELVPGDGGEDFLVGHAQAIVRLAAILQPEHFVADLLPASALLPELSRVEDRKVELLSADAHHLLADDGLDFASGAKTERKLGVDPGGELAHEAGAQHQLVADRFGVGGIVTKSGDEDLGPSHEIRMIIQGTARAGRRILG